MMHRHSFALLASLAAATLFACGDTKPPTDKDPAATSTAATASATATATATASATASATAEPTAEPSADPSADPSATAAASAGAATPPPGAGTAAAATAAATATAKANKYDCGGKGQKNCPMQGWMKGRMARALAGGDKDKIAAALNTIAAKPVAGMGQWSAIAAAGAAKAAAGDIDGAKASCKKCHSLYQARYKNTMRDQPW